MIRATFAGFDTALSAMRMNQKKLDVVGHNLANMNTEGYTRQDMKTSSINYKNPTSFYTNSNETNVGYGVAMDGMRQLRDQFLDKQYRAQNGRASYSQELGESLKALSRFLDETKINGLRASFDDIQKSLLNMQDPSKIQDPVYEGEFMGRVQAMTQLLNSAAEGIIQAEKNEFRKIDGTGTSENGAIQKINTLVQEIGDLNRRIKKNQLMKHPSLELMDERNKRLDELSKYIPIEVETFSEEYTSATPLSYLQL
ncbi:FlgK family flagellar hook-associated protein [Oribacterium parvum]|uniref:FlgK family flagellar hook-associated protein n=1 Tax=Oribacterium parvum TaxID=1501329 RepID=UPI002356EC0C|nr:flagellar basal body protein [Oribacterium parvum]